MEKGAEDFAPKLKDYLENTFSIKVNKSEGRAHLSLPSGTIIHVRGSKILEDERGFYYLQEEDYNDAITSQNRFFAVVYGQPQNTFVFTGEALKTLFSSYPLTVQKGKKPKWYFDIRKVNDNHYLRIHSEGAHDIDIDSYLNKWDTVDDFKLLRDRPAVRNEPNTFVTGYDDNNLKISKEEQILGWENRPSKISTGDFVFVFNTTTDRIESCFEIKSPSTTTKPIWHTGKPTSSSSEAAYPYRWEAILRADDLEITTEDIFAFPPFNSDKKKFSMLIRNKYPRALDDSQYDKFRNFLLGKVETRVTKYNPEKQEYREGQSHTQELKVFHDEKLPQLTMEDIKKGYQKVSEELLVSEEKVIELVAALISGRHVLLAGPIGTGKTHLAKMIPEAFWESVGGYVAEEHTATADWSTQDVIGGIMPKMQNGKVVYEIQYGCVVDTVQKNWQHGLNGGHRIQYRASARDTCYRGVWLVIDEFNRADIDKSFGQLFTALRTHSLEIPTDEIGRSYRILKIPQDYRIIGTLNTADKHFLFGISDALKSRFAYIEVDIPNRGDRDKEIYYAMKNAIAGLIFPDLESLVSLDNQNKKIDRGKSNQEFYTRAYHAYYFLDTVRLFKKLGTAMLQLIYQNMLVATRITGDEKIALDNSLTSTLVPQLEGLPQAEIGAISALYANSLVQFFKSAYSSPNRQSYSRAFIKVLEYLQVQNRTRLHNDFVNGSLKVEDDNTWVSIRLAYDAIRNNFELGLSRLKRAIDDLNESAII